MQSERQVAIGESYTSQNQSVCGIHKVPGLHNLAKQPHVTGFTTWYNNNHIFTK